MTPQRAAEIIEQAHSQAIGVPWVDRLRHVMTAEETAEVKRVWETMPGWTRFVDALQRIAQPKEETHESTT